MTKLRLQFISARDIKLSAITDETGRALLLDQPVCVFDAFFDLARVLHFVVVPQRRGDQAVGADRPLLVSVDAQSWSAWRKHRIDGASKRREIDGRKPKQLWLHARKMTRTLAALIKPYVIIACTSARSRACPRSILASACATKSKCRYVTRQMRLPPDCVASTLVQQE